MVQMVTPIMPAKKLFFLICVLVLSFFTGLFDLSD